MTRRVPLTLTLYFYPRAPRGGRPILRSAVLAAKVFLSTPSARRATLAACAALHADAISIHALREEGDSSPFFKGKIAVLISIHALREEGDVVIRMIAAWSIEFLSTPSARRATLEFGQCLWRFRISIHALREEGDERFTSF